MVDFKISIPDDKVTEVTTAICQTYGYQAEVPDPAWQAEVPNPNHDASKPDDAVTNPVDIPNPTPQGHIPNPTPRGNVANPVAPEEFARQQAMKWINDVYTGWHVNKATADAAKAAQAAASGLTMT